MISSFVFLAFRAEKRASSLQACFLDDALAFQAGLLVSAINMKVVLEIAHFPVCFFMVFQGRPAALNGMIKNCFGCRNNAASLAGRQSMTGREGRDTSMIENFTSINISQPTHDALVHQADFNRRRAGAELPYHICGIELF